jgi:hypothetical protein
MCYSERVDEQSPTVADYLIEALMIALMHNGAIDPDDLLAAIDEVTPNHGPMADTARHIANCAVIRATAVPMPSESERYVERQRRAIRIVSSNDGGNDAT